MFALGKIMGNVNVITWTIIALINKVLVKSKYTNVKIKKLLQIKNDVKYIFIKIKNNPHWKS